MLDAPARRAIAVPTDRAAAWLGRLGVHPMAVTGVGWLLGVGACVAAGTGHWTLALVLWLANRLADGLDGPLARQRVGSNRELGGFVDLLADFSIYAGFVLAVGIAVPEARVACLALLVAYYLSGTAFLLQAPALKRRGAQGDGRSIFFVGGLAEGTETFVAYVVFCLFPGQAELIAWVFAVMVFVTALQRLALGVRVLGSPVSEDVPGAPREQTTPDTQETE